jgi:hypothetical protein
MDFQRKLSKDVAAVTKNYDRKTVLSPATLVTFELDDALAIFNKTVKMLFSYL